MGLLPRYRQRIPIPTLAQVMTSVPCTIASSASLNQAHKIMRERQIRHLPVMRDDQLVGLLSVHDLHLVETFKGVDPSEVSVEDAMSEELFFASSTDGIDLVAATMAARKLGSALVVDDGELVGIFTTIDALRELAAMWGRNTA